MVNNPGHVPPQSGDRLSIQAYLSLDTTFPTIKYEYQQGCVRLMSGGSGEHATIAGNIYMGLRLQFRSGPCTVYNSDMRVQVAEGTYYLPDVSVTCDINDRRRGVKMMLSPRLVVEVLSPSTENIDRTEKLIAYQACATIAEIVLVSQFSRHVEIWQRDDKDVTVWHYRYFTGEGDIEFRSLDVRLSLADIYQEINFNEPLQE